MRVETGPPRQGDYRVDHQGAEIVIRVRADLFSSDELAEFLDWLCRESIRRRASLDEDQIAALADEVDRAMWERLRPMVEEKLRGR
ncbi:MAG TPA: hypothetical protein VF541_17970 [Longimicrobium sp.]|jgi:hypothetical protein